MIGLLSIRDCGRITYVLCSGIGVLEWRRDGYLYKV